MAPLTRLVSVLSDSEVYPQSISFQLYRGETTPPPPPHESLSPGFTHSLFPWFSDSVYNHWCSCWTSLYEELYEYFPTLIITQGDGLTSMYCTSFQAAMPHTPMCSQMSQERLHLVSMEKEFCSADSKARLCFFNITICTSGQDT